jgi:DNA-binding MarR family transcriptional regulator
VSLDNPSLPEVDNGVVSSSSDDVERIVSAWRRERPDIDVSPLEVLSRVTRIAKHLERIRRLTFDAHNLEGWEFDVLAALRRSGEPYALSPSTLMADTLVTSGAMTNRINRLSSRGLVKRQSDPADGRRVTVALTAAGKRLVDETFADFVERESHILGDMSAQDRVELGALLRQLSISIEPAAN